MSFTRVCLMAPPLVSQEKVELQPFRHVDDLSPFASGIHAQELRMMRSVPRLCAGGNSRFRPDSGPAA